MDEGDERGLSRGEMSVEVVGVESAVSNRRRAVPDGSAVVVISVRSREAEMQKCGREEWWGKHRGRGIVAEVKTLK